MSRRAGMRFMSLAAVVVTSSLGFGAQAPPGPRDEAVKAELRMLLTDLNAAMAAHDRAALERIYADEFLFVHTNGPAVAKKAHVDGAMRLPAGAAAPIPSFDGLLVYGDVAVLRAPRDGGFGTTIYAKKNGRWQIVQLQGTATPSTRPAAAVAPEVMRDYVGRYEQDNSLFVTITFEGDHLALQVEGRDKLPLTAESDTKFVAPGGLTSIVFTKTPDGVTYVVTRPNGVVVKGTRVK